MASHTLILRLIRTWLNDRNVVDLCDPRLWLKGTRQGRFQNAWIVVCSILMLARSLEPWKKHLHRFRGFMHPCISSLPQQCLPQSHGWTSRCNCCQCALRDVATAFSSVCVTAASIQLFLAVRSFASQTSSRNTATLATFQGSHTIRSCALLSSTTWGWVGCHDERYPPSDRP